MRSNAFTEDSLVYSDDGDEAGYDNDEDILDVIASGEMLQRIPPPESSSSAAHEIHGESTSSSTALLNYEEDGGGGGGGGGGPGSNGVHAAAALGLGGGEDNDDTKMVKRRASFMDNDDVETYLRMCRKYQVPVDPSIVISLKTQWHIIAPTKAFCEGSMLPLVGILDHNTHIRSLRLNGAGMRNRKPAPGNGNSNARILHQILRTNRAVAHVDLSNTGLDDDGVAELAAALQNNNAITHLNISRNHFGPVGIQRLMEAMDGNEKLAILDVSRNKLGYREVSSLQRSAHQHGRRRGCCPCHVVVEGNFVFEELLNALSHGLGFIASIVGGTLLMKEATAVDKTAYHFWGCAIFSGSLMFLYLASTLFHSFFMLPKAMYIFQILDHCAIYVLIAGSYTPFMMIEMSQSVSAKVVLVAQWVCALCGCLFSMASNHDLKSTMYVEIMFYLAMGLAIVVVWEEAYSIFSSGALLLIVAGGAAYISGIFFFILGNTIPIYHCMWHLFVMVASCLHWFAIYGFVVHTEVCVKGYYMPKGSNTMVCMS